MNIPLNAILNITKPAKFPPCKFTTRRYDTFLKAAQICAHNVSSTDEFLTLVDYKIEDILSFFLVGSDFKVPKNNMDQYWHKVLDYKKGFCYTFDPSKEGMVKLSTDPAPWAMLLLDVSCCHIYICQVLGTYL